MKYSMFNLLVPKADGVILFNTKSTAIIEITSEDSKRIISNRFDWFNNDELNVLKENGFIIDDDYDEVQAIYNEYVNATNNSKTLYLTIMTTLNCNFRCVYCFEHKTNLIGSVNNLLQLERFINLFVDSIDSIHVDWYGGEPLLNIPYIEKISEFLIKLCSEKKLKYIASITTNGFLLSKKIATKLKKLSIKTAQITLDGEKQIHDSRRCLENGGQTYEQIINNIANCKGIIDCSIRCNIDRSNKDHIKGLIDDLCNKGLKDTCIAFKGVVTSDENDVTNVQLSGKELSDILYEYNEYATYKGMSPAVFSYFEDRPQFFCIVDTKKQFIITPDLKLFKCGESYLADDPGFICSIDSFDLHKYNKKMISNMWSKAFLEDNMCEKCCILPLCNGGCSMKRNKFNNPCNEDLLYNIGKYVLLYLEFCCINEDANYES